MAATPLPLPAAEAGPASAVNGAAVTPNDGTDLTFTTRYVYVGVAGSLTVVLKSGVTVAFTVVPAGTTIPICATRVKATGTTASSIVALA